MADTHRTTGPLTGLRVLEAATLFAGPLAATMMADFGADVIKIEHPKTNDPVRYHGYQKGGSSLWWKMVGRNKRVITLYLGAPDGQAILKDLVRQADVLIESFRPGTLERWNIGPDVLHAINPRLVITRVTGFGQFGPYSGRPGFGTLAEAMSGFAAMTGEPDGPPTLPPFGLADGITALTTAAATMFALRARDMTGRGQVVDMAIIEPILTVLGPQPIWYDQFGIVQERRGNRSVNNAPRNTYRTAAQSIAERVMTLVGHPEVIAEPWFKSGAERAKHADELDAMVGGWIAQRPLDEVMREFEAAEAAVAPIYDIRHIMADPQFQALNTITTVPDPDLGPLRMQNVMFRLSETPGAITWAGRNAGADNDDVYRNLLGLDEARMADLKARGVI
jgi:crotonobetainyl-CoA:carnitine CoA-transferase CaiB-like acyl-CoA transferase